MAGTRTPLWAPTPGVPILARVFAYTFAASMLLTLGLTCGTVRPLSAPVTPSAWFRYTSKAGYSISYPVEWITAGGKVHQGVIMDGIEQRTAQMDYFTAGGSVDVEILTCEPTIPADEFAKTLETEDTESSVADMMNLTKYQPTTRFEVGRLHLFTGLTIIADLEVPGRKRTVEMAGQWEVRYLGNKVLLVIACTPKDGWDTMQPIVSQMVGSLSGT